MLIDEVIAGLETGKDTAFDCPLRRLVVAAETGEARLARLTGANERVDYVTLLQNVGVETDQFGQSQGTLTWG